MFALVAMAIMLAVPSATLGWVAQAVAGVVLAAMRGQPPAPHPAAGPGAAADRGPGNE